MSQYIQGEGLQAFVYHQPKLGEYEAGDLFYVKEQAQGAIIALADGLGSGADARASAEVMVQVLQQHPTESVDDLLQLINESMGGHRGAAIAIIKVYYEEKRVEHGAIGNVRCYLLHQREKMIYLLPVAGYVSGKQYLKTRIDSYSYVPGDCFFIHSDGVTIRSPKQLLLNACCREETSEAIQPYLQLNDDDTTYIIGNLL